MPKVYVVNEPVDRQGKSTYDVTPAVAFGQVVYINSAEDKTPVRNPPAARDRALDVLSDAEPGDYLVWAGGDPLGLIIASAIMADVTDGQFTYLKWDRMANAYAPVVLDLFENENGVDDE